jgi:23S rRNA pseudouridine1911/1915/1917 synthase
MHKVLFQDAEVCVVSKPASTHFDEIFPEASPWKAVHRLDFETTGCLLFSTAQCYPLYRKLFSSSGSPSRSLRKCYLAGASEKAGPFPKPTKIEGTILSRYRSSKKVQFQESASSERLRARTRQQAVHFVEGPLKEGDPRTQIARSLQFKGKIFEIELITGVRHQIRSYFAYLKAPLVGDTIYGTAAEKLELHAWKLEWTSPVTGKNYAVSDG